MIGIEPDWHVVVGVGVTVLLGFGVGCIVRRVGDSLGPLPPPSVETTEQWAKLTAQKTGGWWISLFERPIFFAASWIPGAWPVIASWLVFKLGFYWQSANFTAFPESPPTVADAEYLVAKRHFGAHYVATALFGTGANLVVALIGVAVGRWIKF